MKTVTSDIYENREIRMGDRKKERSSRRAKRSRRREKTFDEAVQKDLSSTHRRRSRNSGLRRLRHLYKKPGVSARVWTTLFFLLVLTLAVLVSLYFIRDRQVQDDIADPNRDLSERMFIR